MGTSTEVIFRLVEEHELEAKHAISVSWQTSQSQIC